MTVKITARFPETESANSALGRIFQSVKNIYESRIYYDAEADGDGIANNILYSARYSPTYHRAEDSVSSPFDIDRADKLWEECFVKIVCDSEDADYIRAVIYNSGGFDVFIDEA